MLINLCLAVILAGAGVAHADGDVPVLTPPAVSLWTEEWAHVEFEWRKEFQIYLRLIQVNEGEQALDRVPVMLGVLGQINALAMRQLSRYPEGDVQRAVAHVLVENSKAIRAHLHFNEPAQLATMNAYLNILKREAVSNQKLARASRGAIAPQVQSYLFRRSGWFVLGTGVPFFGYGGLVSYLHAFPQTLTTTIAGLASAAIGVTVAAVTSGQSAPRPPLPWDDNVVVYGIEQCQRALMLRNF